MQQTTYENILTKRKIAHNEHVSTLPQCFQLTVFNNYTFVFRFFSWYFHFLLQICVERLDAKNRQALTLTVGNETEIA